MILASFTGFTGLIIFRFILGAFEASIAPTMHVEKTRIAKTIWTN